MIIISLKRLWPWWLLFRICLSTWIKHIEEYDSMSVARCDANCTDVKPMDQCMGNCLKANYTKPGYCPAQNYMSPFEAACIVACVDDSQCPDLAKCCRNDCGITCMKPISFDNCNDIPPIPESIEIRREKSNLIVLSWKVKSSIENLEQRKKSIVRYLVEERHVLGPRYLESRLSAWSVHHVANKPQAILRAGLKSGHWYQFRVAAVNINGSRGYSSPSGPFKTTEPRNPQEPRNLILTGARVESDGKLRILLRWNPPSSDIPIMFYKMFWSRLIHGPPNDSIFVNHKKVAKEKACYELKNLELGFQYFFQVQAITAYGGRRLASRKVSKVFNSTDYNEYADSEGRYTKCELRNPQLRVSRLICQCAGEQIEARLIWPPDSRATSYNVSWNEQFCETSHYETGKLNYQRIYGTQITAKTREDIKGLRRNCTYTVNVRSITSPVRHPERDSTDERKISIEFMTNACQKRRKRRDSANREDIFQLNRCRRRKTRIKRLFRN